MKSFTKINIKNVKRICLIGVIVLMLLIIIQPQKFASAVCFDSSESLEIPTKEERLKSLEPQEPKDISDIPRYQSPMPANVYSFDDVVKKGTEIPLKYSYNDPDYKRPAYKEYWHSTIGRWSYVPNRIHYALHRLFATIQTASIYYDFVHDLGIAEESNKFKEEVTKSPFDNMLIVVFQTKVEKIFSYKNQIIIIGKPQLTGLTAFEIPIGVGLTVEELKPTLIQLYTPQGDEIDYTMN